MNTESARIGRSSAGFAMAAAITVLFNTALAWVKDADQPLLQFMNKLAWHNWITQGLADVILFVGLGLIFARATFVERMPVNRLISFLVAAVLVAGVGLFAWYVLF